MVQTSNFRTEKNSKMSNFRTKAIHHSFIIPKSDQLFARIIATFLQLLLQSHKLHDQKNKTFKTERANSVIPTNKYDIL